MTARAACTAIWGSAPAAAVLVWAWSGFAACSTIPSTMAPERVPAALVAAEDALAADDAETALSWMRSASLSVGLTTEVRDRVQLCLERAAARRIDELSRPGSDPEDLAELVDFGLPRQLAVSAGVASARLSVAADEPEDAFRILKKLDSKFPLHHERQAAGDLLCDVGLRLIQDSGGFLGWFSTRDEGLEILEYVVLNQPWAKRCDEAYDALSRAYETDREWDLAIARAQALVLDHPASRLRIETQARIPHVRLESLKSPEYDRVALQHAREELQEWLIAYGGHPLESEVRIDLGDCLRRLADNDLIVARFYERVGNEFGARWHAERAIAEARDAGDADREREVREWLAALRGPDRPMVIEGPPSPPPSNP